MISCEVRRYLIVGSGATLPFPRPSSLEMPNFLKKPSKTSKKSGTPENTAHQATDTGAESDRDPEGEYRSRDLRADKADGTD